VSSVSESGSVGSGGSSYHGHHKIRLNPEQLAALRYLRRQVDRWDAAIALQRVGG
jgi:hypothetical protein